MSAIVAVDMGGGSVYEPLASIIEVSAVIGVDVGAWEVVPVSIVVVVTAVRAVRMVIGRIVPKAIVVVVAATGVVVVAAS